MLTAFSFVHGDRTYSCHAEELTAGDQAPWWWFTVTRDGNRYAPFQAATHDTRASVQARIVAYYARHLECRSAPAVQQWARRPKVDPQGAAVAAAHRARIAAEKAAAAKAK